jgi:hypothetical protein
VNLRKAVGSDFENENTSDAGLEKEGLPLWTGMEVLMESLMEIHLEVQAPMVNREGLALLPMRSDGTRDPFIGSFVEPDSLYKSLGN